MINLKNVKIIFDEVILTESSFEAKNGTLTGIKGESGAGKSSLLDIISLYKYDGSFDYDMDDIHLRELSESQINRIMRTEIAYLRQETVLLSSLNCLENVIHESEICGSRISEEEAKEILQSVHLEHKAKVYPEKLSGGEEQRLAIAMALAKRAKIIICDEITSMLDQKNTEQIMEVLKRLAHDEGKTVILASHETSVMEEMDVLYEIKDKQLHCIKDDSKPEKKKEKDTERKLTRKYIYDVVFSRIHKRKIRYLLITLLCALSISLLWFITALSDENNIKGKKDLEMLSQNEMYIYSFEEGWDSYRDNTYPLNDGVYEKIKNIDGIKAAYPFFGMQICPDYSGDSKSKMHFKVTSPSKTIEIDEAPEDIVQEKSYLSGWFSGEQIVFPYFEEQQLYSLCEQKTSQTKGAYINYFVADYLGILDLEDNSILEMDVYAPVGEYKLPGMMILGSNSESPVTINYVGYKPVYEKMSITVPIAGILPVEYIDSVFLGGCPFIYIPNDLFTETENQALPKYVKKDDEDDYHLRGLRIFYSGDYSKKDILNEIYQVDETLMTLGNAERVIAYRESISNSDAVYLGGVRLLLIICMFMVFAYGMQHKKDILSSRLYYQLRGIKGKEYRLQMIVEMMVSTMIFAIVSFVFSNIIKIYSFQILFVSLEGISYMSSFVFMCFFDLIISFLCALLIQLPVLLSKEK